MNKEEKSLSTAYFSKEFPSNWEVEWKANLLTQYPLGFLDLVRSASLSSQTHPFREAEHMGVMPVGLQYQHLLFHYYGHKDETGIWVRDLVLVQPPGTPIYIPQMKVEAPDLISASEHGVVLRAEQKGGLAQAIPQQKLEKFLEKFQTGLGQTSVFVGTIDRDRYSVYLQNLSSLRNYSLVADISVEPRLGLGIALSQVEVEYKGRSGISANARFAQGEILTEFDQLSLILRGIIGTNLLIPTKETKFDWLIKSLGL